MIISEQYICTVSKEFVYVEAHRGGAGYSGTAGIYEVYDWEGLVVDSTSGYCHSRLK